MSVYKLRSSLSKSRTEPHESSVCAQQLLNADECKINV